MAKLAAAKPTAVRCPAALPIEAPGRAGGGWDAAAVMAGQIMGVAVYSPPPPKSATSGKPVKSKSKSERMQQKMEASS